MKELSLHIMDIVGNSLEAGADDIRIVVQEDWTIGRLFIQVIDNGKGMSQAMLEQITDPFVTSRTTRKVGLGIPLLEQHATQAGGKIRLWSTPSAGTVVTASFSLYHPDRQPLGDLAGTVVILASSNPGKEILLEYVTPQGQFVFDTKEIKAVLEVELLSGNDLSESLKNLILNNLEALEIQA